MEDERTIGDWGNVVEMVQGVQEQGTFRAFV